MEIIGFIIILLVVALSSFLLQTWKIILICLIVGILFYIVYRFLKNVQFEKKNNEIKKIINDIKKSNLTSNELLENDIISDLEINLKDKEKCFYKKYAKLVRMIYDEVFQTDTYNHGTSRPSVIFDDWTKHFGHNYSTTTRNFKKRVFNIDGILYLTNQRIIFDYKNSTDIIEYKEIMKFYAVIDGIELKKHNGIIIKFLTEDNVKIIEILTKIYKNNDAVNKSALI